MTVAGPGLFDLDDLPLLSMLEEQKRAVLAASPLGGLLPGECGPVRGISGVDRKCRFERAFVTRG